MFIFCSKCMSGGAEDRVGGGGLSVFLRITWRHSVLQRHRSSSTTVMHFSKMCKSVRASFICHIFLRGHKPVNINSSLKRTVEPL